jgi:hypothetical protein
MKNIINKQKLIISKAYQKIKDLQKSCPHKNVNAAYKSDTGNYDPSEDIYWVEVSCLDCGKFMSFDSKRDNKKYRSYPYKYKR